MQRVLATIKSSQYNISMISQQTDLVHWVTEIHDEMYKNLVSLLPTYFIHHPRS
jgi:hypothetical protein